MLHTEFTGILNDKLHGFYRSTFTDADGVEQVIATTQFEATDARRAFPCWDEPDFKAVFGVTLVVDDDLAALSNAAEISRDAARGRQARRALRRHHEDVDLPGGLHRRPARGHRAGRWPTASRCGSPTRGARATSPATRSRSARFALEFFADYYGIDYPGDKLDLVAVPDFAFGAMENLGCVTFREVLVLVDPDRATQPELQRVTDVIAHELAHMWFGDLVTMKWWNGIWLNEAFATFMEMLCTDAFRPEWDRWTTFGLSRTAAFDVDALKTTRPIEFPVVSPDDAEGMFDILTYEKGAAVVRMLEQYLGAEAFRDGIRAYLRQHSYGNTETTDLWDALEETTGEPVRRIMDSWIFQGGFPVIDVELLHDEIDATVPAHRAVHPAALRLRRRHRRGRPRRRPRSRPASAGSCRSSSASRTPTASISFEKVLIDEKGLEVPTLKRARVGAGQHRGHRLLPGPLRHRPARRDHGRRPDRPLAHRALRPGRRRLGRGARRRPQHASTSSTSSGASATRPTCRCGSGSSARLGSLDRLVDGAAREALRARVRELTRPPLDRLGPEPVRRRERPRPRAAGRPVGPWACSATTPRPRRRPGDLYDGVQARSPARRPDAGRRRRHVIAATGGPAEFDEFVERLAARGDPQEELRFLSALADFDDAELDRTGCWPCRSPTPCAPRTRRTCCAAASPTATTAPGLGVRRPTTGTRSTSGSRPTASCGCSRASAACPQPDVADTVFRFFEDHEVPQGDKTLAQHLERLEVNVALRRGRRPAWPSTSKPPGGGDRVVTHPPRRR